MAPPAATAGCPSSVGGAAVGASAVGIASAAGVSVAGAAGSTAGASVAGASGSAADAAGSTDGASVAGASVAGASAADAASVASVAGSLGVVESPSADGPPSIPEREKHNDYLDEYILFFPRRYLVHMFRTFLTIISNSFPLVVKENCRICFIFR